MKESSVIHVDPAQRADGRRAGFVVALLTLVGAALRLATVNTRGLWLDEAVSVKQASKTLPQVIATLAEGVHPPLFHILMHYWIQVFGLGEVTLRLFAMIWGVLSIPAAYWAGRVIYGRRSGLVAAGLVAFAPYLIWYSQEARMYSMMLFFGLLSVGFMAVAVRENRTSYWVGYTATTFLGMFTHYFFIFLVLGEVVYFVFLEVVHAERQLKRAGTAHFRWSRPQALFWDVPKLKPWLISAMFLGVTFGAWLSRSVFMPDPMGGRVLVSSATGSGLGYGQMAPSLALRFNDIGLVIVEMVAGFHPSSLMFAFVAMWPLLISAILVGLDYVGYLARASTVVVFAAFGIVVIFVLGQWQGQVLASRYFIALAAPALLLVAGVIGRMPHRHRVALLSVGVLVAMGAWANQSFNPRNLMLYDNREAISSVAARYEPGDIIIYEPFYLDPLFTYYMPAETPTYAFPQYGEFGRLRNGKAELTRDLEKVVGPARRVWLILSFQDVESLRGDAYNTTKWFERNGFVVKENRQLSNVQVLMLESESRSDTFDLMRDER